MADTQADDKRIYRFVEVPLVGYVLQEDSFTFGYKEYYKNLVSVLDDDVSVYVTKKENISQLEQLITRETTKGSVKTVAEGIGGVKGDILLASRIGSVFIALSLENCALLQALIPLILVPGPVYPLLGAYIFKRLGEKGALEQMKKKIYDHIFEYDAQKIIQYLEHLSLAEKIQEYALLKQRGNRWAKVKRIWKLEIELDEKRKILKQGFAEVGELCTTLHTNATEKAPYETCLRAYKVVEEIYQNKWWQNSPVILGK